MSVSRCDIEPIDTTEGSLDASAAQELVGTVPYVDERSTEPVFWKNINIEIKDGFILRLQNVCAPNLILTIAPETEPDIADEFFS